MRAADGLHSFFVLSVDFTISLWYDADKPRGDMQQIKKHETRSEQRGFGSSKPDGADAREAERRGFGSSKPDGADAREAEQHDFGSSKPKDADVWEMEQRGFDSNEANGAGI